MRLAWTVAISLSISCLQLSHAVTRTHSPLPALQQLHSIFSLGMKSCYSPYKTYIDDWHSVIILQHLLLNHTFSIFLYPGLKWIQLRLRDIKIFLVSSIPDSPQYVGWCKKWIWKSESQTAIWHFSQADLPLAGEPSDIARTDDANIAYCADGRCDPEDPEEFCDKDDNDADIGDTRSDDEEETHCGLKYTHTCSHNSMSAKKTRDRTWSG